MVYIFVLIIAVLNISMFLDLRSIKKNRAQIEERKKIKR